MAIIFNKYIDEKDHTWYDSSNVIYSVCYDSKTDEKCLKIIFKNGRTYLYNNVDVNDYIGFKMSESQGKGVNQYIVKKYDGIRLSDTDMKDLEELKNELMETNKQLEDADTKSLYHLSVNDKTGEFVLLLNNTPIYRGVEGEVSIINLFASMNIKYSITDDYIAQDKINEQQEGYEE